jgi:hypothetical protein
MHTGVFIGSTHSSFIFLLLFYIIIDVTIKIHVLGPKYHPLKQGQSRHITAFPQSDDTSTRGSLALYMMMGTGLHPVKNVPGTVLHIQFYYSAHAIYCT